MIGLFDSGFGGLTVMKELIRVLPNENIIYLGDTKNLPYGNKSPETIIQYARNNAHFLLQFGIKLLIIPCHTACCHALHILQEELSIPVLGVIEAGLELLRPYQKIAVLGTTSTIASGIYQKLILKENPNALVIAKACPLFVPLIEEGYHEDAAAKLIAKKTLSELQNNDVDATLLACTHYPLIKTIIQEQLGNHVTLLEPAANCAQRAKQILSESNALSRELSPPTYKFYVSDDPDKFKRLGKIFFGTAIEKVELNKNL